MYAKNDETVYPNYLETHRKPDEIFFTFLVNSPVEQIKAVRCAIKGVGLL